MQNSYKFLFWLTNQKKKYRRIFLLNAAYRRAINNSESLILMFVVFLTLYYPTCRLLFFNANLKLMEQYEYYLIMSSLFYQRFSFLG